MLDPRIDVTASVRFPAKTYGREPLITTGHSYFRHFLFVEYGMDKLRLISKSDESEMVYEMPRVETAALRMSYTPVEHALVIYVTGSPVIQHRLERLVSAPAEIDLGRNISDPFLT